jgi:hypothetical protein
MSETLPETLPATLPEKPLATQWANQAATRVFDLLMVLLRPG